MDIDHNKGNDDADDAVERGITDEQTMLGTLAEIYDKRQQEYTKFMEKVQWFIIKLKEEEKSYATGSQSKKTPSPPKKTNRSI